MICIKLGHGNNFVIACGLLYPSPLLIVKLFCLLPDPMESCFNKHNLILSATNLLFVKVLSRAAQIPQLSLLLCTNNFCMHWLYVGESKIIRTIGTCFAVGYTAGWA